MPWFFSSYERALDITFNWPLLSKLFVLNGHLRSLDHIVEMIIAIF